MDEQTIKIIVAWIALSVLCCVAFVASELRARRPRKKTELEQLREDLFSTMAAHAERISTLERATKGAAPAAASVGVTPPLCPLDVARAKTSSWRLHFDNSPLEGVTGAGTPIPLVTRREPPSTRPDAPARGRFEVVELTAAPASGNEPPRALPAVLRELNAGSPPSSRRRPTAPALEAADEGATLVMDRAPVTKRSDPAPSGADDDTTIYPRPPSSVTKVSPQ